MNPADGDATDFFGCDERFDREDSREPESLGAVRCVGETDLALCVLKGHGLKAKKLWIPKSVVHDDSEVFAPGTSGELVVMKWWAEKESLV